MPPYKHPSSNPTPPIWTRRPHMCTCRTSAFTRVTFSHSRARDHTVDYTVVYSNLCGNQTAYTQKFRISHAETFGRKSQPQIHVHRSPNPFWFQRPETQTPTNAMKNHNEAAQAHEAHACPHEPLAASCNPSQHATIARAGTVHYALVCSSLCTFP